MTNEEFLERELGWTIERVINVAEHGQNDATRNALGCLGHVSYANIIKERGLIFDLKNTCFPNITKETIEKAAKDRHFVTEITFLLPLITKV